MAFLSLLQDRESVSVEDICGFHMRYEHVYDMHENYEYDRLNSHMKTNWTKKWETPSLLPTNLFRTAVQVSSSLLSIRGYQRSFGGKHLELLDEAGRHLHNNRNLHLRYTLLVGDCMAKASLGSRSSRSAV